MTARTSSPFVALYRTLLGTLVTRGRILALAGLGAATVAVGAAVGLGASASEQTEAGARFVNGVGLSVLVPVVALVFASAAFGDLLDDGTLVYLWLRPIRRSLLAVAAFAAALTIAAPLTMLPIVAAAAATGGGTGLVVGAAVASTVALIGYVAVFCALGLRVQRSLVWGLAYVLIWEGFVASAGRGASRLALRSYSRSILAQLADVELRLSSTPVVVAVVVPLAVAAAAIVYISRRLSTTDVP